RMGMDTISTGVTIACAMELFEKGYLPQKKVGRKLAFGDGHAVVEMVEKIAQKKGFGKELAEGSYRLAAKYGHPELSMSAKKLEFPSYDPRGGQGFALAYATSNRGGCHIRNEVHCVEFFGISLMGIVKTGDNLDRFSTRGKPAVAKKIQDFYTMIDSSGICNFIVIGSPNADVFINLMEKGTGLKFGGLKGFLKTGERIYNLERMFNLKAGLTAKDDTLPKRMLTEPMPEGPGKGQVVQLNKMLPEYYRLRGWTAKGIPSARKLKELGIAA
ncbi:MAG: aldehyde ferredoxin oxidoreductase C-terminal domain-containing protein, partial [Desulfobacterales bacterium]|nr:aldehyde ferredoxin oxidoreductase C-terminal domain-containing protein [Desulfobacterales bacterium]